MKEQNLARDDHAIPVKYVIPLTEMIGIDQEETSLLQSMASEAEAYLNSFSWCRSVQARYFGAGIGGVVGVFFFQIRPSRLDVDIWLWVIVGDLPAAYLVVDECKTPSEALTAYIWEMKRWVKLAEKGKSSPHVIPVNVPMTREWAKQLGSRLRFLEFNVLPSFKESEIERA